MTVVSQLQHILVQLRSSLAAKAGQTRKARSSGVSAAPQASLARTPRPTIEELRSQISSGLTGADLNTSGGRRQARRVFLESVLVAEFGVNLAGDARFSEIVTEVQDSFEQEPALLTRLDAVLDELRRG